jgi:hypothetical protein
MARCAISGSFRGGAALLRCWGTAMVIRPPLQSFAHHGDQNFSPVRCAAVFEEENTLQSTLFDADV